MNDLYACIEQHKLQLIFLQENDICNDEDKVEIVSEVKRIFDITKYLFIQLVNGG